MNYSAMRKGWERYLRVFDKVIVCARIRESTVSDKLDNLLLSNHDSVEFVSMPDFRGAFGPIMHYGAIRKALWSCLNRAHAAIFRMPSPISFVAYPIISRSGLPWAAEMMMNPRTAYGSESTKHLLQPLIQKLVTAQTKQACLVANGVSYVTDSALQEEYPCKAHSSNDPRYFTSSYSTISLSDSDYSMAEWEAEMPSTLRLVHTGKMSDDRKGHSVFIEVVALLKREGVSVHGTLIGDGPQRSQLEAYAAYHGVGKECEFVGWKAGFSEVQRELQKSHFLIMPTKSEGLPRAIIEAMASGLVCYGNAVDGIPELLDREHLSFDNSAQSYVDLLLRDIRSWEDVLKARSLQHEKSFQYSSRKLASRRANLYQRLRDLTE